MESLNFRFQLRKLTVVKSNIDSASSFAKCNCEHAKQIVDDITQELFIMVCLFFFLFCGCCSLCYTNNNICYFSLSETDSAVAVIVFNGFNHEEFSSSLRGVISTPYKTYCDAHDSERGRPRATVKFKRFFFFFF